jgi:3-oxoacid CoA-transferase
MATAADLVIAEVEHIVPVGSLDPDHIHTPGIFVDYLVEAHIGLEDLGSSASVESRGADPTRLAMARRALAELRRGDVVNLGIGIPTLVADLIRPEDGIILHTENGMLGVGPVPESGGALDYPVNAGKVPVTALPGASYFDSAGSFGMIRGGHVDGRGDGRPGGRRARQPGQLGGAGQAAPRCRRRHGPGQRRPPPHRAHDPRRPRRRAQARPRVPPAAHPRAAWSTCSSPTWRCFASRAADPVLVELMPGATLDAVRARTAAPFTERLPSG